MKTKQTDRTCNQCGQLIPVERLRTLPDTWECVRCSSEQPKTIKEIEVDGSPTEDMVHSAQSTIWN